MRITIDIITKGVHIQRDKNKFIIPEDAVILTDSKDISSKQFEIKKALRVFYIQSQQFLVQPSGLTFVQ